MDPSSDRKRRRTTVVETATAPASRTRRSRAAANRMAVVDLRDSKMEEADAAYSFGGGSFAAPFQKKPYNPAVGPGVFYQSAQVSLKSNSVCGGGEIDLTVESGDDDDTGTQDDPWKEKNASTELKPNSQVLTPDYLFKLGEHVVTPYGVGTIQRLLVRDYSSEIPAEYLELSIKVDNASWKFKATNKGILVEANVKVGMVDLANGNNLSNSATDKPQGLRNGDLIVSIDGMLNVTQEDALKAIDLLCMQFAGGTQRLGIERQQILSVQRYLVSLQLGDGCNYPIEFAKRRAELEAEKGKEAPVLDSKKRSRQPKQKGTSIHFDSVQSGKFTLYTSADFLKRAAAETAFVFDVPRPFGSYASRRARNSQIRLSVEEMARLWPGVYLSDQTLDFWIANMIMKIPNDLFDRIYIFHSLFFSWISSCERNNPKGASFSKVHERVASTTKHVDIFEKDIIFMPVNVGLHWTLAVICNPGLIKSAIEQQTALVSAQRTAQEAVRKEREKQRKDREDRMAARYREQQLKGLSMNHDNQEPSLTADAPARKRASRGLPVKVEMGKAGPAAKVAPGEEENEGGDSRKDKGPSAGVAEEKDQEVLDKLGVKEARQNSHQACQNKSAKDQRCMGNASAQIDKKRVGELVKSADSKITKAPLSIASEPGSKAEQGTRTLNEQPPSVVNDHKEEEIYHVQTKVCDRDASQANPVICLDDSVKTEMSPPEEIETPLVIFLDSLRGGHTQRTLGLIRSYLEFEWKARKGPLTGTATAKSIVGFSPNVPTQHNNCDCGVFMLEYFDRIAVRDISGFLEYAEAAKTMKANAAKQAFHKRVGGIQWFKPVDVAMKRWEIANAMRELADQYKVSQKTAAAEFL